MTKEKKILNPGLSISCDMFENVEMQNFKTYMMT